MNDSEEIPPWKERLYRRYRSTGQATSRPSGAGWEQRAPWAEHIASRYLPDDHEARIVDLGCGDGMLLAYLEKAGYRRLEGVEISGEQVRVAREACGATIHQAEVSEHLAERPAGSADVVLATDLLEHFPRPRVMELLEAIHRVLGEGGRLVAQVPNGEGIFGPGVRYGDLTHELAFTESSVRQALLCAGFDPPECDEIVAPGTGLVKVARRAVWRFGTLPLRMLYLVERGRYSVLLSRNLIVCASR